MYHDYPGTTQATDSIQVRARVGGYLDSVHFQDGANVSQGQLLFIIDQRPYVAQLDQAKAELESRRATAVQQESVYRRTEALLPSGAVTQQQADVDRGNWLAAQAAAVQSEAAVRQAQLNLDYTQIRAPIAGKVGRRLVDPGNLITANTTLLTTITQYNPMYAYFNASEANYLAYLKRQREKGNNSATTREKPPAQKATAQNSPAQKTPTQNVASEKPTTEKAATSFAKSQSGTGTSRTPVELGLANETGYPHRGYIDFAEPGVDPGTGTLLIRGVFDNPEPYRLVPGFFVRLRVPIGTNPDAMLVPEKALGMDQSGSYLLIVGPDNVVEHRTVTTGTTDGNMQVIEQGLKPGERFIVEGLQRARPGEEVNPVEKPAMVASRAGSGGS